MLCFIINLIVESGKVDLEVLMVVGVKFCCLLVLLMVVDVVMMRILEKIGVCGSYMVGVGIGIGEMRIGI